MELSNVWVTITWYLIGHFFARMLDCCGKPKEYCMAELDKFGQNLIAALVIGLLLTLGWK